MKLSTYSLLTAAIASCQFSYAEPIRQTKPKEAKAAKKASRELPENAYFIRIELPGKNKTITLTEIEVITRGRNAAKGSKSTSSSVANGVKTKLLTDSKKDAKSVFSTKTEDNPWLEVDLKRAQSIGQISIFNNTNKDAYKQLEGFSLVMLNKQRKEVYRLDNLKAPKHSLSIIPTKDPILKYYDAPIPKHQPKPSFKIIAGPKHSAPTKGQPPVALKVLKNSHIGFVGGGLGSRMNLFNEFETELQRRYPQQNLYIRNLCHEGDTPAFRPHPSRRSHWVLDSLKDKGKSLMKPEYQAGGGNGHYETPDTWLKRHGIDTVIGFFGYSESFDGTEPEQIDRYKEELRAFINNTLKAGYTKNGTQLAIVGPAAFEDLSSIVDLPDGTQTNKALSAYTNAMQEVCKEEGILFIDAFSITSDLYKGSEPFLTSNGHNLNEQGYKHFAPLLANNLFGSAEAKNDYNTIKKAVAEKNKFWVEYYKIPNGVHVHGRRYRPYGNVNYPDELIKLSQKTSVRDNAIWAANKGQSYDVAAADAKTHKLPPIFTNSNRPDEYRSGQEVAEILEVAEGYKVELFASEETFPDLQNPSQMAFDNAGRLWVGCMGSYPHWRVGDPAPNDKIIILEDTDNDGKADKQTTFVDHIHIPMGFEITEKGVFVSLGKNLVRFEDTDGDSKADTSEIVLSGFDDHDTHHAISSFCADPSGAIYMGEGVFSHSNVETPYGPVRGTNGGFYRYNVNKMRLERTAQLSIPNPWGIAFNDWGQNFFLHTSGTSFSWMQQGAIKPRYNQNLKSPSLLTSNAVRPTSGVEFVSSRHFPDEVQGDIILCNNIGFLGTKQHQVVDDPETGFFKTTFRQNLFNAPAEYQYFRPVDLEFAPDGSLYFIDWSNVLIGHMQHSARDPKRDKVHGRVYRVTYPSRPLVKPAKVAGASIDQLLENLKLPEIRTRYRTRRELRGRDHQQVYDAVTKWAANLDTSAERYEHHLLEALWVSWGVNKIDSSLLEKTLVAKDYRARAAAVRSIRYNADKLSNAKDLLLKAADDEHPQVRHEALVQASWMGKKDGLEIINVVKTHPSNSWSADALKYAEANLNDKGVAKKAEKKLEKGIISDKGGVTTIQVNCIKKAIKFDVGNINIKKGRKIKLIFNNPDDMQHNLVVVKPGTADSVAMAAIQLGPKGNDLHWIPAGDDVIAGTKLLEKEGKQTIEFTLDKPGKYPFICSFPGHATAMRGHLIVK